MDSDKGPVVFPLLTLGEVLLSVIFVIISLADYFLGCISLTPNRLNQQGKNIRYCVYCPTRFTLAPKSSNACSMCEPLVLIEIVGHPGSLYFIGVLFSMI